MSRVLAIGLDAADWRIIERLLRQGALPNFARIRARSAECVLQNEAASRTTLVWEAFLTGRENPNDPRSGGVAFDGATYRASKVAAGETALFYEPCPGLRTIAFDVPHLAVSGSSEDVRVCSWGTHAISSPPATRPPGLLREIDAAFGRHPAFRREHRYAWHNPLFTKWLAGALAVGSRRRVDVARWLQARYPDWDLFLTVMSEVHSAGENFGYVLDPQHPLADCLYAPSHRTRLDDVYLDLDAALGKFVDDLPRDAVLVVFSLHGTAANDSEVAATLLFPELLYRLAFGRPLLRDPDRRDDGALPAPIVPPSDGTWDDYMRARFGGNVGARFQRALRSLAPGPLAKVISAGHRTVTDDLGHLLTTLAGDSRDANLDWQVPCWYRPHWPRMKAFALPTFADARLRLNVRRRERDGIVDPNHYDATCSEVELWLRACRNPRTGRPVVAAVTRPRANDPMARNGPDADLVVRCAEAIDCLEHPGIGIIGPFPFRRTGAHTGQGFALFSGPGIAPRHLGEHRGIDLPATILMLLGREHPSHLDGRSILQPVEAA
jgi:predicted AlkP superfamily phosphohydrolase/phosphomutase